MKQNSRKKNVQAALAGRLNTRPPIDRMQRIFQAIKAGSYPNRPHLAGEIEVTTKTIQRDLDFMRDRLNLPIAYNEGRGGYEFTEPVENFPLVELSESELVSVYVAQQALSQYRGTSFEQPLRSAFGKLASSLEGKISLSWNEIDSCVSFKGFERSASDLKIFQTVGEAVRKSVVLEFEYKKLNSGGYEKRRVEPWHLACVMDQWYCFAHDLQRDAVRTFVLARMKNVKATGPTFERPEKFDIGDYLKDSLGVFSGKGSHKVRIRFDSFAAQLVREKIWHPSQEIQELTHGGLELKMTLSSLHEIESWVLSWGSHARVLGPAELRKRLAQVGREYVEVYG